MIKHDIPFYRLYSCVSPEDFAVLFEDEFAQTIAFILSFCPKKRFVKKVISLLEKKEKNADALEITSTIREYLSRCHNNSYDNNLVSIVEEQILIMTDGFKNYSDSKRTRKRFLGFFDFGSGL